jgi:hypothetical protein
MKGVALMCKKPKQKHPLDKPGFKGNGASARRAVAGFDRNLYYEHEDPNSTFTVDPQGKTGRLYPKSK